MIIHDIFIQGIRGLSEQIAARSSRVEEENQEIFSNAVALDKGIEPEWMYKSIRSLFFPTHPSKRMEALFSQSPQAQICVVFSDSRSVARTIRGADRESISLQFQFEKGGQRIWETVATGSENVERFMAEKFERPSSESFEALVNWCDPSLFYQPNEVEEAIEEAIDKDLSINSLMIMYENAYSYEQAQAKVGKLSERLMRQSQNQPVVNRQNPEIEINARHKASLESEINSLFVEIGSLKLGDLSQDDFEKARKGEKKISTSKREILRLKESLQELQAGFGEDGIRPSISNPKVWIPLLLAIACVVVTIFLPAMFAPIALISIPLTLVSTIFLVSLSTSLLNQVRSFKQLERLEQRLADEHNAQASAQKIVDNFLTTVECHSVTDCEYKFVDRQRLVHELATKQMELKNFLETVGEDGLPKGDEKAYEVRNPNETLIHELEAARGSLDVAEKPILPSKAIANEIIKQGFDPSKFAGDKIEQENLRQQESVLLLQMEQIGYLKNGVVAPQLESIWNQILHRFMHGNLYFTVQNREIIISKEKSKKESSSNWKMERPNVFRWVLFSLKCAVVELATIQKIPSFPNSILCIHPSILKRPDDQQRLKRIITGTSATSWLFFSIKE